MQTMQVIALTTIENSWVGPEHLSNILKLGHEEEFQLPLLGDRIPAWISLMPTRDQDSFDHL